MPRAGCEGRRCTQNCVRKRDWKQFVGYRGMGCGILSVFRERSGEAPFSKRRPPQRNPAGSVHNLFTDRLIPYCVFYVIIVRREKGEDTLT